jgi:hypothetical protein
MGAKLKSKTHLQNTFFIFWAVFCAFDFKVWKKYKYDLKNKFLEKIKKGVKKRRISHWFRIRWKSCEKQNKFDEHE